MQIIVGIADAAVAVHQARRKRESAPREKMTEAEIFFQHAIVDDDARHGEELRVIKDGEDEPSVVACLDGLPLFQPEVFYRAWQGVVVGTVDVDQVRVAREAGPIPQDDRAAFDEALGGCCYRGARSARVFRGSWLRQARPRTSDTAPACLPRPVRKRSLFRRGFRRGREGEG